MHAVRALGIALEYDADRAADFGEENRAHNSGSQPERGFSGQECFAGVLALDKPGGKPYDAMRAALGEDLCIALELHAHLLVDPTGRVIPFDFVGSQEFFSTEMVVIWSDWWHNRATSPKNGRCSPRAVRTRSQGLG